MGKLSHFLSFKAGLLLAVCFVLPMIRGCGYESITLKERSPLAFTSEVVEERPTPVTVSWAAVLVMFFVPHLMGAALAFHHFRVTFLKEKRRSSGAATGAMVLAAWLSALFLVFSSVDKGSADKGAVLCGVLAAVFVLILPGVTVWHLLKRRLKGAWSEHLELVGAGLCLWWFATWAVTATFMDEWSRLAFQAQYGLYIALGASGLALMTSAFRLVKSRT